MADGLISILVAPLKVLYHALIGTVKAILPSGILPRKSVVGEIVLITGSGSGLGRLMAIEFGKLGARLVLWDMNEKGNMETKKMVEEAGAEAHCYTINLVKRAEIYSLAEKVKTDVGNVDILINNAGIVTGKKLFESSDELMELTMAVNTNALFYTAKAFVPHMIEKNHGHIVTISSMAGKFGTAGLVDYCASKFGAVGFAESLSAELHIMHKDGVHSTLVCPYFIDTGMFHGVQTKAPLSLPILQPDYVVSQIMEAVLTNKEVLMMPRFCYLCNFLANFLPTKAAHALADFYGSNEAMEHFVGRSK